MCFPICKVPLQHPGIYMTLALYDISIWNIDCITVGGLQALTLTRQPHKDAMMIHLFLSFYILHKIMCSIITHLFTTTFCLRIVDAKSNNPKCHLQMETWAKEAAYINHIILMALTKKNCAWDAHRHDIIFCISIPFTFFFKIWP